MKKKDYDKKLFRLIKILNVLQESRGTDTAALAAEFNISRRTAQRDIGRLVAAGFRIEQDELKKGFYRFCDGYSLKGLSVSDAEASLLVSLCDVARSMGGEFSEAYGSIFAKVMNTREWESPFFVMMPKPGKHAADAGLLAAAREAVERCRQVRMRYKTAAGEEKAFDVEPLKLVYHEGFWYLLWRFPGGDRVSKNRLDRVLELETLAQRFTPPKGLQRMLRESENSIWFGGKRDKPARIQVSKDAAPYFLEQDRFPLQKVVKRNRDGSVIVETKLCHFMEALPTIYRWIPQLVVLSPKELADEVRKQVSSYLKSL